MSGPPKVAPVIVWLSELVCSSFLISASLLDISSRTISLIISAIDLASSCGSCFFSSFGSSSTGIAVATASGSTSGSGSATYSGTGSLAVSSLTKNSAGSAMTASESLACS